MSLCASSAQTMSAILFASAVITSMRGLRASTPSGLLWLPPIMQEGSDPSAQVIECGLLSGLLMQHFQKPLAGMVIRGSDPNLMGELLYSES